MTLSEDMYMNFDTKSAQDHIDDLERRLQDKTVACMEATNEVSSLDNELADSKADYVNAVYAGKWVLNPTLSDDYDESLDPEPSDCDRYLLVCKAYSKNGYVYVEGCEVSLPKARCTSGRHDFSLSVQCDVTVLVPSHRLRTADRWWELAEERVGRIMAYLRDVQELWDGTASKCGEGDR